MSVSEEKIDLKVKESSHMMTGDYAILMETSGEEMESWYYFIRVDGNEESLKHLQEQLDAVDWYILDDLSTFDLDLDHYVSAQTAKEMSKVELNHCSFHRKFDGKLKKIDFGLSKKDKNKRKIKKVFDILGYGSIEEFIDDEDIDPEDLVSGSDDDSEDTDNESVSSSDSEDSRDRRRRKGRDHDRDRDIEDRDRGRDKGRDIDDKDYVPPSVRIKDAIRGKQEDRRKGGRKSES